MRASLFRSIPSLAFAGAALAAAVAQGCGLSGDDLFGGTSEGTTGAGASGSGVGAAGSVGPNGSGGDSSGPGPASGTDSSGPGPGPGAGGQGGEPSSGPGPGGAPNGPASTAEASVVASSSSGPPPDPAVDCNGSSCVIGSETCCWDTNDWNGGPQGECVTGSPFDDGCSTEYFFGEMGAETRIECQLPEHCPGQVCCGHRTIVENGQNDWAFYSTTVCESFCGGNDRVLCDPNGPDVCPGGTSCQPSTLLPPGYFVCAGN